MRVKLGAKVTGNRRKAIEREIMKFAGDDYLWHKHVSGIDLNPHQTMWSNEIDKADNHILIGSRRIRKSFTVAAKLLKEGATKPYSEINVHSPALEQSKRNLRYMHDMIMRSEILLSYIDERLGEGIGKEHIEFMNRSLIQAKGQASSIDGLGATHQWLEEFDDMDWDTFMTRIFPTGSQIKDDHKYGTHKGCLRIVTGTIKGIGNLHRLEKSTSDFRFNVLPKFNCYHGIAMGIIPEGDIKLFRAHSTPHQFVRTYLCKYVESAAFYPEKWVNKCQDADFVPVEPIEGMQYVNTGEVRIGIDAGGAGGGDESANWAATVTEKIGNRIYWLYSKEWSATERPDKIREDLKTIIGFFRPIGGFGDAFDVPFLYDLNRVCYDQGLTRIDVRRYENKQGKNGWDNWYIKPLRFTGPAKHQMHERMQKYIYSGVFRYPYIVQDEPQYATLEKLISQFGNIKAERSNAGYNKYSSINLKLGDDIVDSCIASVWAQDEIKVSVYSIGSWVPQMDIAGRPAFQRLGENFLHDSRRHKQSDENNLYKSLRSD